MRTGPGRENLSYQLVRSAEAKSHSMLSNIDLKLVNKL